MQTPVSRLITSAGKQSGQRREVRKTQIDKRKSATVTALMLLAGVVITMSSRTEAKSARPSLILADIPVLTVGQPPIPPPIIPPPLIDAAVEARRTAEQNKRNTPLLSADLDATAQWAIYDVCDQENRLFCTVMAIAWTESRYQTDAIGDGGSSIGMMQINTRWSSERMERLGVTDLTDLVQNAMVAVDLLRELMEVYHLEIGSHDLALFYNMGPTGARRAMDAGTYETAYTQEVTAMFQAYLREMEGSHD